MNDPSLAAQRVLVTGAFGNIGQHAVRELAAAGHTVRALRHRSDPPFAQGRGADVEVVRGDVRDRAAMDAAVRGVDAVLYRDYLGAFLEEMGIGRLPDEAFSTEPYCTDCLDSEESQRLLGYQRRTFDDKAALQRAEGHVLRKSYLPGARMSFGSSARLSRSMSAPWSSRGAGEPSIDCTPSR